MSNSDLMMEISSALDDDISFPDHVFDVSNAKLDEIDRVLRETGVMVRPSLKNTLVLFDENGRPEGAIKVGRRSREMTVIISLTIETELDAEEIQDEFDDLVGDVASMVLSSDVEVQA